MRPLSGRSFSSNRRIRRSTADFAAIFLGLVLLALVGLGVGWQVWHTNRIYTGVTVNSVAVGGMSRAAALKQLEETHLRHTLPPINVQYGSEQWPVTSDHVRARADFLGAVNRAYLVGRQGTFAERMGTQFDAVFGGVNLTPEYSVEPGQLRSVVNQIAADVRRSPRAGTQIGDTAIPAQPGLDVDVEATVQSILNQLAERQGVGTLHVPLQVVTIDPPSTTGATANGEGTGVAEGTGVGGTGSSGPSGGVNLPATFAESGPAIRPLLLRDASFGLEFALDGATVRRLLLSHDPVVVDMEKTRALLIQWSEQINISPRDARLRFNRATNSPVVLQTSRSGRQLDVDATASAIQVALTTGTDTAPMTIRSVAPAVDSNRLGEMGIQELVGSGTSYFAGSSAARVRNIVISAEKFDGVVIPPGGIFSFNHFVEDVSAANGFEDSLIIWGDRTAVGIGGGICQVSTTVFRAAYFTGMPIVERYNHGYIVDWYGEPGLDATIYTPTVDFRFRNDTSAYLLIEPVVDTANGVLTFNFYGTKPNRTVTVGNAVITDVQPAPPPLYTIDNSLAPGARQQVEWQKQGMTVRFERTIVENGVTRTDALVSRYQPWRAIYLVGPGYDVPEPAAEEATALLTGN